MGVEKVKRRVEEREIFESYGLRFWETKLKRLYWHFKILIQFVVISLRKFESSLKTTAQDVKEAF